MVQPRNRKRKAAGRAVWRAARQAIRLPQVLKSACDACACFDFADTSLPRNSVLVRLTLGVIEDAIRANSRLRDSISVFLPYLMSCKVEISTPSDPALIAMT